MKILVFSPYYPPHIGGLETHSDEFNKYFSQAGNDIVVYTFRLPLEASAREYRHNERVNVLRFPAFEIIPNYPLPKFWSREYRQLKRELLEEDYDLVISRTRFFVTSLLVLLFSHRRNLNWVHIEHGSDFVKLDDAFNSFLARAYDYTFGRLVLAIADKVIANSKASAAFSRQLWKRDIEVIYRGVEIEKIEAVEPRNLSGNTLKICFLGRLIDGKGVKDLFRAVSQIKNDEWKLHIIGDGPQKQNLETLAEELEIKDKVTFWGKQAFESAIGILKACDIVVNPSYTEGLPTSVIEAALCRKAIIATNVGGTSEIIENEKSGFLVEPKDVKELQEKIEKFLQDDNLRIDLGKKAYLEVKGKFDWSVNIQKYLELFQKISHVKKKIFFLSSRHGGPFKQHSIIAQEFRKRGFQVEHRCDLIGWIKAHFFYGKNRYIITNVPLLFRFSKKNFLFNIKGNYTKERNIVKNPLGYFYGLNKLWSEKIILPSEYLREILCLPSAIVIPNAVSEKLTQESRQEKEMSDSNQAKLIMVTMFGFREKAEGALRVVECLSQVETNRQLNLDIWGLGTFEEEIKKRAKEISLPKNIQVSFRGYGKSLDDEYRRSDVFVYWSDLDVMPNVFLEAMAFGLPIVANNFPSFKYILGESNLISRTREDFVKNLSCLLADADKIRKMGIENKKAVLKNFSLDEAIWKKWEDLVN